MNNFIIELVNISKTYNAKKNIKVLKNLNFKFKKGKTYSIIGPSGSGKSTLLNIISLIDKPSSGNLFFNKVLIKKNNSYENDKIRANKIGIIYQDKNLLSDFSALENVYLANLAVNNDKKLAIKKAISYIKKVGLENRLDHLPNQLSGGESQRIAICRAIINEPQIILADEPTGSLDKKNALQVFNVLSKLKNKNRTIIYATHNRLFANYADYKIELVDGRIKIINGRK